MERSRNQRASQSRRPHRANRNGAGADGAPAPVQEKSLSAADAYHKIVYYLSGRDHSERELRQKLARRFEAAAIDAALARAAHDRLLKTPEQLAEAVCASLLRRKKSAGYIRQYLRTKGLPDHPVDEQAEVASAHSYLRRRYGPRDTFVDMDREVKKKAHRALAARGFSPDVIRSLLYE